MKEKLKHLLIPATFRVYCRPNNPVGDFDVTVFPSKANCANCLTAFRIATTGRKTPFKVCHTCNRPEGR